MLINKPLILSTGTGATPAYTIDQSIRFNEPDDPRMGRTPSATGTEETWTWSFWIKRANLGTLQILFQVGSNKSNCEQFNFNSSDQLVYQHLDGGSNTDILTTTQLFRDISAWYHIVLTADTTHPVDEERIRIYVNGARVTDFSGTPNYPVKDTPTDMNTQVLHQIGAQLSSAFYSFDGYMAEIVLLDGTATDCNSFGEFNSSGIWIPKDVSGLTFGTNGFHINGSDASGSPVKLGDDESSNGNDFTTSGMDASDQVADSPTNNFAVLSSISNAIDETLTNGNLQIAYGSATTRTGIYAPYGMTSGKWYWEVYIQAATNNPARVNIGIASTTENDSATRATSIGYYPGYTAVGWSYYGFSGQKVNNATQVSYGDTFTAKDIIGVAYDADNGDLFFYKNNAIQNSGTAAYTGLSTSETYFPAIGDGGGSDTMTCQMNFGQDSTFSGLYTQSNSYVADSNNYVGASDGNGVGSFFFTPPTGYLALCTKNLGS